MTADQRAAAADVLATWVQPVPPPPISGDAIIGAIAKADRAKLDPCDRERIAWRDDVPVTNAKLKRMADTLGTTPDALRQAAAAVA